MNCVTPDPVRSNPCAREKLDFCIEKATVILNLLSAADANISGLKNIETEKAPQGENVLEVKLRKLFEMLSHIESLSETIRQSI